MNSNKTSSAAGAFLRAGGRASKRRAYVVCTILAAVFIIATAVVLMGISDNRVYNDYMNQAQQLYYNKDYDGALSMLRKAAAVERSEECLMLMADCYETQGNYTKALEVLRSMDTKSPAVSARIGSIEQTRRDLSAAETVTIAGRQYKVGTSKLVLDNQDLGDAVTGEIRQLYALDSLSLAGNSLRDVSGLSGLGGLVTLNLSGNEIRDISPLTALTGLRTLYLDSNPIEDLSPLYRMGNLTSLSIKNIEITETQLSELSKALPNCAIHSEKAKDEKQDISFGGVTFQSDVTELDLSGMGIRDISALSNCQFLTRLNLSGNEISDLSPLMNLPYLQWLDVSFNTVSDLRPLMGIETLSFLNASGNYINGTSALTMMDGLRTLYLDENPIKDFSGLRKLRGLSTLGLNGTGIDDESLRYLRSLSSLAVLNIKENPALSGEGVNELKAALPGCEIGHSDLSYLVEIDGHTVQTDASTLSLPGLGIVDISNISQLPSLQIVDLSANFITNIYPFEYTDSLRTIVSLNLGSNGIKDLTPLSKLRAVETLDLSNNNISVLQPLTMLTTLRTLVLIGNPLSTEEVEMIRTALPDCEVIF